MDKYDDCLLPCLQYLLHTQAAPLNIVEYRSDNMPNNLYMVLRKAMQNSEPFLSSGLELTWIPSPGNGELWLLPGSRQTLQYEHSLGAAQHRQDPTGAQSHYTGAFHAVLEKMSRQAELDIIFVDCSPSCGNFTRLLSVSKAIAVSQPTIIKSPAHRSPETTMIISHISA